jgi:hypothetical protein
MYYLRYFPLEFLHDEKDDPMHYGKMLPGHRVCITGAIPSIVAVKLGVTFLVESQAEMCPELDWGCNLFLIACRKKNLELIKQWETLTHQKIEYYGWCYGYKTAVQNKDEYLKNWFQSQFAFHDSEVQEHLQFRKLL